MANMQLLSRLGAAPIKYLVTPAARLSWQSVTCSLNKGNSYPKHHDVFYVKELNSFGPRETTHFCRSGQPINSSWGQQKRKKTSQDGVQVTSSYKWKPKHPQNSALLGHRGHGLLTYLKCCLGQLTQQFVPVRHYKFAYPIPEKLEPWVFPVEPLGTTFTSYLSDQNVETIRILAQAEFNFFYKMSFFGKTVQELLEENKPTRKLTELTEDKLFGLPLDLLMKKGTAFKNDGPHLKIPSLLCLLLQFIHKNGLTTQGIFKAPESSTKVKKLKEDIESNFYQNPNYEISNEYNAHDVAAALKDFIADLQMPLMTTPVLQFFPDFFVRGMETRDLLIGLRFYILMMAPEHRDSLQMLLTVLNALTQNSAENGLTVEDCANIFWPVLFSLPPNCSVEESAKRKKQFFDLTRVLVHYNDYLFTVSPEILNKLRRLRRRGDEPDPKFNQQLEPRPRMTAISFASMDLKSPEFEDGLKRFTFGSSTTAEELVQFSTGEQLPMERLMEKLKCHILGKDSKTSHFLFENGGNLGVQGKEIAKKIERVGYVGTIDHWSAPVTRDVSFTHSMTRRSLEERVLDPKTKIISLYRENSSATYVIKTWNGYNVEMSVKVIGNIARQRPVYGVATDLLLQKEEKEEDY